MLHHRFRNLVTDHAALPSAAFVAWPLPAAGPAAMWACLAYRLAAEMLAAQSAPAVVRPAPAFSRN